MVYDNINGDLVIRDERDDYQEQDTTIVITRHNVRAFLVAAPS